MFKLEIDPNLVVFVFHCNVSILNDSFLVAMFVDFGNGCHPRRETRWPITCSSLILDQSQWCSGLFVASLYPEW